MACWGARPRAARGTMGMWARVRERDTGNRRARAGAGGREACTVCRGLWGAARGAECDVWVLVGASGHGAGWPGLPIHIGSTGFPIVSHTHTHSLYIYVYVYIYSITMVMLQYGSEEYIEKTS
jgi:hypothetical protein